MTELRVVRGGYNPDLADNQRRTAQTMRATGATYPAIAARLNISMRRLETILGEAAKLRDTHALTYAEIGSVLGVGRRSVPRMLGREHRDQLTMGENLALHMLVDMYGIQADVLARLLDIQVNHTYAVAARLRALGMAQGLVRGDQPCSWVIPTNNGVRRMLGRTDGPEWWPRPEVDQAVRLAALTRAVIVGPDYNRWISERTLRSQAHQRGGHVHSGRFETAGEWWALQIETSTHQPRQATEKVRAAVDAATNAHCAGLLYICRGPVQSVVEEAASALPDRPDFRLLITSDRAFFARHGIADPMPRHRRATE